MINIIPNWHPIFVHFTVALLTISAVMFVVERFAPEEAAWRETCLKFARWNLWLGAGITVITLLAGWQAYNTVAHDTPSHAAMTDHKNWAFVTAGVFALLATWSVIVRKKLHGTKVFASLMLLAVMMLGTTAWKGGEVVYRYGLGVMSMPQPEKGGHSHGSGTKLSHSGGHGSASKTSSFSGHSHGSVRRVARSDRHAHGRGSGGHSH